MLNVVGMGTCETAEVDGGAGLAPRITVVIPARAARAGSFARRRPPRPAGARRRQNPFSISIKF
jgi:hypothetical protein